MTGDFPIYDFVHPDQYCNILLGKIQTHTENMKTQRHPKQVIPFKSRTILKVFDEHESIRNKNHTENEKQILADNHPHTKHVNYHPL